MVGRSQGIMGSRPYKFVEDGFLDFHYNQLKPNSKGIISQWDRIEESSMDMTTVDSSVPEWVEPLRSTNFYDLALAYQTKENLTESETVQTDGELGLTIKNFGQNTFTIEEEINFLKEAAAKKPSMFVEQDGPGYYEGLKTFKNLYRKGLIGGTAGNDTELHDMELEALYRSGEWDRTNYKNNQTLGQIYRDMASNEIEIHDNIADQYIVANDQAVYKFLRGLPGLNYGPHDVRLTRIGDGMYFDQANSNLFAEVDDDMSNADIAQLIKEHGFSMDWSEKYDNKQIMLQDALEHKETYTVESSGGWGSVSKSRAMHQKAANAITQGMDDFINSGVVTREGEPSKKYVLLNTDFKVDDDLFAFNQWIGPDADKAYGIGGGSAALLLEVATPIGAFWGLTKAGVRGAVALGTKGIIKQANKTHMTEGFIKANFDCSSPCKLKPVEKQKFIDSGKAKGLTDDQINAATQVLENKATLKTMVDDMKSGKTRAETRASNKQATLDRIANLTDDNVLESYLKAVSNQERAAIKHSEVFENLVRRKFKEMSTEVDGKIIPPTKKDLGEAVGIKSPGKYNPFFKLEKFSDLKFLSNDESRQMYLNTSEAIIASGKSRAAVNLTKSQIKANNTNTVVVYGGHSRTIDGVIKKGNSTLLFPENNPQIKKDFLENLRSAYIGSRGRQEYTLRNLAEDYDIGYSGFITALKKFKTDEGLNSKLYSFDAPTGGRLNDKAKRAAIKQWLNNPNVLQSDKDLWYSAKDAIKIYNSIFPDDIQNIDHVLAFVNSKNKVDAQTISNLQITDKFFNQITKKTLFENPAKGFKKLAFEIKNAKDKPTRQRLMKKMQKQWKEYVNIVEDAGYYIDTTGLPFLPKSMQIKKTGTFTFEEQINNLKEEIALAMDKQAMSLLDRRPDIESLRSEWKKGGFTNGRNEPERGRVTTPGGYAGEGEEDDKWKYEDISMENTPGTIDYSVKQALENTPGTIEWSVKQSLEGVQKDIREIYENNVDSILYGINESKKKLEIKKRDMQEIAQKRLNPPKPAEWKWSETPKLLTESPIIRGGLANLTVTSKPLLDVAELFYNGINNVWGGKNIDMEKEFPGIYAMHKVVKGEGPQETPKEQTYISVIDEINRAQETGLTRLGFNVTDLMLSIPDAILPTGFTEELQRKYEKMNLAEPETFLGQIGALATEWGVPGAVAFKIINRFRTFLKASSGGKVNMFTQKTYGLTGLRKGLTQFSNVSKRVGSTAVSFGLADFVAGGPYNTLETMFDNPLLTSKIVGKYEDTDDLYGDERVVANFKNRLRFGAEGMMIGALFPLAGPPLGYLAKNTLLRPALWAGSMGARGANYFAIKPATWLLSKDPIFFPGIAAGTGTFAKFLGKDVLARLGATVATGGKAFMPSFKGPAGQLPEFGKWRMFDVTSKDPLKRGLKRVDNFLQWFRDSGNQALNHFYLSGNAERFIKKSSREIEKYLNAIEARAYDLANGFLVRYNKATTSPAGERYMLEQVYEYMKGNLKLNKLEPELRELSKALKEEFDLVRKRFFNELPEGGGLRQALETNLDKYMRMSFATFTNPGYAPSTAVRNQAVDFMVDIIRKNENLLEAAVKGSNQPVEQAIRKFANQNVDSILAMGKVENRDPIDMLQRISKQVLLNDDVVIKTGEELPLVIKKLLGQEKNLRYSVMSTANSVVTQTTNLRAWREAAKRGIKDGYLFETREAAMAAGVMDPQRIGRVPGLGLLETEAVAAKGGPVGLYATPEVVKTFAGTGGMLDSLLQVGFYQGLIAYKAAVQTGKTVFSPATQSRNFFSAGFFPMQAGHIGGNASVKDAFKIILDDIFGAGRTVNEVDMIKSIIKKVELGVLDENIVASELSAILKDIKAGKLASLGKIAERVDKAKFYQTATRVYAGGDNVWKWYGHEWYKSQLKGAFKNMDEVADYMKNFHGININRSNIFTNTAKTLEDGVEEVAAYLVRETYPTYSKVPEFIKAIRKLPLGNFVSFTSEILRTGFATTNVAVKHIASNNQVLREQGYRMLTGQGITLWGINEGVSGLASMMTGISDAQLDAYKKYFAPDFMKYSNLIPITKMKDGVFKVFDMSRFHPYDIISSSASQMLKVVENRQLAPEIAKLKEQLKKIDITTPDGEAQAKALRKQIKDLRLKQQIATTLDPKKIPVDVFKAYFNTVGPLWDAVTGTFLGMPIGAEAFTEAISGKTREGSTIWNEGMRDTEKFDRALNHFFKTIEPGIFSSGRKLMYALKQDVSGVGQPIEIETEMFKLMGGSNMTIDVPGSYDLSVRDLQKTFIEPKMGTGWYSTKNFRSRGPAVMVAEYEKQNQQAFRAQYEFWKLSQAALDAGFMTRTQIAKVLEKRIGNKKVVMNVLNGRFSAVPYGQEGLAGRMNKILRNNPYLNSKYGFSYFLPLGALEKVKGKWDGKLFKEMEVKPKPKPIDDVSAAPQISQQNLTNTAEAPATPMLDSGTPTVSNQQASNSVNPQTGLTSNETALLSPTEQAIRLNQRGATV